MQVNCTKCSRPIALTDVVESNNGRLSHVDCKRPHVLTPEERALVFVYCSSHVVARCPACDISYRYTELAADMVGGSLTNMCPRCRRDLTEAVRAHLLRCVMLPEEVRLRAQAVRDAARHLVKESQQLHDKSDVLIREAEAALFERQRALREAMSRKKEGSP
jgi:Arc/MetJ family transcription regulator